MDLTTYLSFNGQCAQAFRFYERALNGHIEMMMTNGESPMADQTPPEQRDRIMHASLTIERFASVIVPILLKKRSGFSEL